MHKLSRRRKVNIEYKFSHKKMEEIISQDEHVYRDYVTIGEAASILGVSVDTVRRREKAGQLVALRLDGKNRYFALDELETLRSVQPLSTTEVARILNVSSSTVRRLESTGQIISERDQKGRRLFNRESVDAYANGEKFEKALAVASEVESTDSTVEDSKVLEYATTTPEAKFVPINIPFTDISEATKIPTQSLATTVASQEPSQFAGGTSGQLSKSNRALPPSQKNTKFLLPKMKPLSQWPFWQRLVLAAGVALLSLIILTVKLPLSRTQRSVSLVA